MRKAKPFRSAKKLDELIDSYFHSLEADPVESKTLPAEPPTFAGLLLFTGFSGNEEFDEYKAMSRYAWVLSRAKLRIQEAYEKRLLTGSSGGIVSAMNNILGLNNQQQAKKTENKEDDNVLQVEIVSSDIRLASSEKEVVL